ncbi:N-acetylneuraminate synthase family protein [Methanoplanus endosymbiosus]|uniref:N-acetylneuraminate synthase family protein n=1 Tax=Methanoplanus endosymbiosus TaxID=33865 RepID=A0A9E7TI05_9EURY|nr:N-acetylneuraminate synthase family protein [Methanoplanus endosymbiosus]UUX91678.1 N-acetylneuraminate synthase family protein [Methanoplanus endosymbiosus]
MDFENLESPYFIGEIGINHNGDLQIAKKLMDAVFACGWDCVKFQKRNPDVCVPEKQKNVIRDTPWGKMTYLDYKYKVEFGKTEYDYINKYCKEKPLNWTTSVWDLDSLQFTINYDVPFIKIPSALLTNLELLKEAAQTDIPLIVSTGMSTFEEIDTAINLITKHGAKPVLMHTNSSYPTPNSELNLNLIPVLKKRYDCIIGYSGHEYDLEPTVIAVALGAQVIERHITISHNLWGTDQKSSLEVHAMDLLKKRANEIWNMLGSSDKVVTPSEIPIREKLRIS